MIHKYKILKTSWGIVIFLDAEEIINPVINNSDTKITNRIYLRTSSDIKCVQELFKPWLEQGIKALADKIYNKIGSKNLVCFNIKDIDFEVTDFQEEGFYCAIQEWLAKYYGFEIETINVFFDQNNNKYIFDIPQL